MSRNYTICAVGFCAGKSSLISRFIKPRAKWEQIELEIGNDPTTTASHHMQLTANGAIINVNILDTNGLEAFKEDRDITISRSHGILLCYSICYRNTFEQLHRFLNEIAAIKGSLSIPMMLVGTMNDRESERTVLPEEAIDLADFLGIRSIETSAKTGTHVTDCFFSLMKEILKLERRQSDYRNISLSTSSQSVSSGVDLVSPPKPVDADIKKKKRSDSKGEKVFKSMVGNSQITPTKEAPPSAYMNQMSIEMKESSKTRKAILKEWINLIGLESSAYRSLKKLSVKSLGDVRFVTAEDLKDWQPVSRDKFLHYTADDSDLSYLLDIGIHNPFFPIWFLNGKRLNDQGLARIVQIITTWKYRVTGLYLQDNEITDLSLVSKLLQNNKDLMLLNISNNPFKIGLSDLIPFIETWRNLFKQNNVLHYLLAWNSQTYYKATAAFGELRKHLRSINRKHIRICVYQWQLQFVTGLTELLRLVDSSAPRAKPDTYLIVPQEASIDTWIELHRLKDASKVLKNSGVKFVKDLRFVRDTQLVDLSPFLRNKLWYLMQLSAGVLPRAYRYDRNTPMSLPSTPVGTVYRPMPGPETNNNASPKPDRLRTSSSLESDRSSTPPSTPILSKSSSSPLPVPQPVPAPQTVPQPVVAEAVLEPPTSENPPSSPALEQTANPRSRASSLAQSASPSQAVARMRAFSASGRKVIVDEDISVSDVDSEFLINYKELVFQEILGTGSYGVVYRALYRYQEVAVKQLHAYNFKSATTGVDNSEYNTAPEESPKFKLTQEEMDQFYHEAELMKNLRPHANVVLFLGICCEPLCIITEFLPGGTLENLLKNTSVTLTLSTLLNYALDAAAGLNHLHKENIIHRDLATRNLLMTDTGRVKIGDFGMSRFVNNNAGQTKSNTGPLRWMSPESLVDRTYSKHSDMWSFGCVMVELLTRDVPFPHLSPLEAAYQVAFQTATPTIPQLHDEGSNKVEVPSALRTLIQDCFDQTPELRPTADDMCSRLLHLKLQLNPQSKEIQAEEIKQPARERLRMPTRTVSEEWTVVPLPPVPKRQSSLILSSIKVQQPSQVELDRKKVEEELDDVINYLLDSKGE